MTVINSVRLLRDFQEINYLNKRRRIRGASRREAACRRLPQRHREHRGMREESFFVSFLSIFFHPDT